MTILSSLVVNLMLKLFHLVLGLASQLRDSLRKKYYRMKGNEIGNNTYISPKAFIDSHKPGRVSIGENCYITRNVVILCHTDTKRGGPLGKWEKQGGKRVFGDVRIGNNVFIGVNSVVMPGVTIGDDVIIGALSLVANDIPEGKIAVGSPAKAVGETKEHLGKCCQKHAISIK